MEQPRDILQVEHAEWLTLPVTSHMILNLKKHRETLIRSVSNNATTDDSGLAIRYAASGIRTIDAILVWTTDSNKFVEQSTK